METRWRFAGGRTQDSQKWALGFRQKSESNAQTATSRLHDSANQAGRLTKDLSTAHDTQGLVRTYRLGFSAILHRLRQVCGHIGEPTFIENRAITGFNLCIEPGLINQ